MSIHNPLHPGVVIHEILIEGAGLSVTKAAKELGIDRTTLSRLFNGHAGVSPEMALRLAKLLPQTDMKLWMNLQRDYDIWNLSKDSMKFKIKPLKNQPLIAA